jgi:hypothetical protein
MLRPSRSTRSIEHVRRLVLTASIVRLFSEPGLRPAPGLRPTRGCPYVAVVEWKGQLGAGPSGKRRRGLHTPAALPSSVDREEVADATLNSVDRLARVDDADQPSTVAQGYRVFWELIVKIFDAENPAAAWQLPIEARAA